MKNCIKKSFKHQKGQGIKRPAFTLAEVLITLAIIGVVAALTIPTVVRNYQIKQYHTQLLKAQSVLSQALNMAIMENGNIDTWVSPSNTRGENGFIIINKLKPYLKIDRMCGEKYSLGKDCFYAGDYKTMLGGTFGNHPDNMTNYVSFRLVDGLSVNVWKNKDIPCDSCGEILIDTNGVKPPNTAGVDLFMFNLKKDRIVPSDHIGSSTNSCNINSTSIYNGVACTKWFIMKGNMDYLHKDVTW